MKHSPAFLALVEEVMPRIREISADELVELQEKMQPLLLIDVREDHEWQHGHIRGAQHLSRGILERDIETRVPDKAATVVLYCGGGFRSALSADSMQKMGYSNVRSLAGGWREWNEKKLPVTGCN
ncbi:MAG: sulfurtransferase [Proteobacteria bacterium]|nr:sulfurtransferase [Pseudomonadota bacterium]